MTSQQRNSKPPQPIIQSPIFGELKDLGDEFEINITVPVLVGRNPAQGFSYQFIVDGAPFGAEKPLDARGQATARLQLSGKKPPIAIQLRHNTQKAFLPPVMLGEIELPKRTRKIELRGTVKQAEKIHIVLRRIGKNGKPETGNIAAWDFEQRGDKLEWKFLEKPSEAGKDLDFERPLLDTARKIVFFLPDDEGVKISILIPARSSSLTSEPSRPFERGSAKGYELASKLLRTLTRTKEKNLNQKGD